MPVQRWPCQLSALSYTSSGPIIRPTFSALSPASSLHSSTRWLLAHSVAKLKPPLRVMEARCCTWLIGCIFFVSLSRTSPVGFKLLTLAFFGYFWSFLFASFSASLRCVCFARPRVFSISARNFVYLCPFVVTACDPTNASTAFGLPCSVSPNFVMGPPGNIPVRSYDRVTGGKGLQDPPSQAGRSAHGDHDQPNDGRAPNSTPRAGCAWLPPFEGLSRTAASPHHQLPAVVSRPAVYNPYLAHYTDDGSRSGNKPLAPCCQLYSHLI
jgi:hypothetical protein